MAQRFSIAITPSLRRCHSERPRLHQRAEESRLGHHSGCPVSLALSCEKGRSRSRLWGPAFFSRPARVCRLPCALGALLWRKPCCTGFPALPADFPGIDKTVTHVFLSSHGVLGNANRKRTLQQRQLRACYASSILGMRSRYAQKLRVMKNLLSKNTLARDSTL